MLASANQQVLCASFETPLGGVLYPFLLRPIAELPWARRERGWDLVTPYGYGGPFAWGIETQDAESFWRSLNRWLQDHEVVCSFARLSLFPDTQLEFDGDVQKDRPNVVRSLDLSGDDLWRDYASKVRRNVNRARSNGLTVEVSLGRDLVTRFAQVYLETMERRGADDWYRFSPEFLDAFAERLGDQVGWVVAFDRGHAIAGEMVLFSVTTAYSFLVGTKADSFILRPADLVKHEASLWARSLGKARYVLGGGVEPYDSIYDFKRSFAPRGIVPFRVASKVHDVDRFDTLVKLRASWKGVHVDPGARGFFPPYRA
jgi:Acetyltransferase (GNAT) domain